MSVSQSRTSSKRKRPPGSKKLRMIEPNSKNWLLPQPMNLSRTLAKANKLLVRLLKNYNNKIKMAAKTAITRRLNP